MENPLLNFLLKILGLFLLMIAPIRAVILTVGFLILADLATGIWAAIKRQERITSRALRRTLSKFVVYQIAILSGFLIEKFIIDGDLPIVKVMAGYIAMTELKSMLENGSSILGENIFMMLIQKLGGKDEK